jgi:serine/threonine protein kinase
MVFEMATANQRVGEYLLDERIAAGTFGEVWRAHHHVWADQRVAVKIPTNPQYLRNLQNEGSAIHGLVHPNIVRAIGFDPYAPTPYLAMEYVPGTSLRPVIQKKTLKIADTVAILRQVLTGLSYAHCHGLVHRDVKPENILVHERTVAEGFAVPGLVKVTDFGLGKAAAAATGSIAYSASLNDDAGREIAGSLDYMAPEQRAGGAVDARADLYACGVMLYEMLTGEKPAGTDVPSDLNRAVPKQLDEVFRRSYARLERRYASADELLAALGPPAAAPPAHPASPPSLRSSALPPPLQPPPRRQPPAVPHGTVPCPRCHGPIGGVDQFCMHCGVQVVAHVRRCRSCGSYPSPDDQFCMFCGAKMAPEMATA